MTARPASRHHETSRPPRVRVPGPRPGPWPASGRHETGLSVRYYALELGFHGVPPGSAPPERDADGASVIPGAQRPGPPPLAKRHCVRAGLGHEYLTRLLFRLIHLLPV